MIERQLLERESLQNRFHLGAERKLIDREKKQQIGWLKDSYQKEMPLQNRFLFGAERKLIDREKK